MTLLSPRTGPVAGDRLGVDLLAPVGSAPVLDGIPDTPLVAPEQADVPEMVALRNLGESDPTGVHSATTTEALAARHRPGLFSAALGAAILAGLAGFAVRHRVLDRSRRRPAASSPARLVEVSVRSRPDA